MLNGFTALLLFQIAGEILVQNLYLPMTGPICGMALLFCWLCWRGGDAPADLVKTSDGLLANMAILFVPIGVSVMTFGPAIGRNLAIFAGVLVVSTLLSIAASALAVDFVMNRSRLPDGRSAFRHQGIVHNFRASVSAIKETSVQYRRALWRWMSFLDNVHG